MEMRTYDLVWVLGVPIWGALPARLNSMFEQEFNAVERREIKDIWPAQYPVSRGQWGSNYVATRPVRYYAEVCLNGLDFFFFMIFMKGIW